MLCRSALVTYLVFHVIYDLKADVRHLVAFKELFNASLLFCTSTSACLTKAPLHMRMLIRIGRQPHHQLEQAPGQL